jgi:hypothetical protein
VKKILCKISAFFESVGRAKAAAALAQRGLHKEANELMNEKESKC